MDIEQLIFPFVMAVLTNSIMIVIVYFLRKVPAFANLFSVWFMVILYLFCVLRIFLPIEFPEIQIIIKDSTVYSAIIEPLISYDEYHSVHQPSVIAWIIICVWFAGTVIIGLRSLISQRSFKKYLLANGDYATDEERALFAEVATEVLKSDKNVALRKTDVINGTVVIGLIHNTVLIPDEDYSENELRIIFRHECMHIKDKDLWIKLLVQIYCCIFWWNPFAYLLKRDLDMTLEMKCDYNTTKEFSDKDKLLYVETLKDHSVSKACRRIPFVVSAELANGKKKDKLLPRINKLLSEPPNKAKQIVLNTFTAVALVAVFAASYLFILQPRFGITEIKDEYYELNDNGEIIDGNDAYLVKNSDGDYMFYVADYEPILIPKEEVEAGLFEGYPIYENR